ncbi:MAG: mercuric reductase [Nitrospirae bacterium]|nr:mercuric reductase [Nitrospirota bacterium]
MTTQPSVLPQDPHNLALVQNVHPRGWKNPTPEKRYNLVVIGGGTAGLVTAAGAAGLGAKVALVEKHLLGGDCLNYGCVPSKALIRASRAAADARDAGAFGVTGATGVSVNFPAVMERMRGLRAHISEHDSATRFRGLGVDVFLGEARFNGTDTVEVDGAKLRFRRAVIATGGRATGLPIPGLAKAGFLTNETIFSLTRLPARLAVIGAGPIGCEMAQAFRRFGSEVCLLEAEGHVLPREDREAASIVAGAFKRDGIRCVCSAKISDVESQGATKTIRYACDGTPVTLEVDEVLVGVGRSPNVEGLGLESAGIEYDTKQGIRVDDRLRTTNPRVLAAGDVCSRYKFTHAADFMARIVIQNALFFGRAKVSALTIPWCTYTDPEIAHVGLYEHEAESRNIMTRTFTQKLDEVDRAVLDGESDGFVKVLIQEGTDRILGATIVARHAGEMISEITLAMTGKLGLKTIAGTIHPYPTQAEAIRKVGDAYNRTRLTPFLKGLFARWLAFMRR